MKPIKLAVVLGIFCLPLATLSVPAAAATAHNSQAGAMGPTTNNNKPSGIGMRKRQMNKRMKGM